VYEKGYFIMHNSWLNVSSDMHTSFFVAEYHKMRPLLTRDKTKRQSVNVLRVYKGQVVVALKQQHLVRRTTVATQHSPKETIYIPMYIYTSEN
jgi:hypothetical protein